jgi:hypothetical protein
MRPRTIITSHTSTGWRAWHQGGDAGIAYGDTEEEAVGALILHCDAFPGLNVIAVDPGPARTIARGRAILNHPTACGYRFQRAE